MSDGQPAPFARSALGERTTALRTRSSVVLGGLGIVILLTTAWSLVASPPRAWLAGAVSLFIAVAFFLVLLRPKLAVHEHGVVVVNPLRDAVMPWAAITDLGTHWNLELSHAGGVVKVAALPRQSAAAGRYGNFFRARDKRDGVGGAGLRDASRGGPARVPKVKVDAESVEIALRELRDKELGNTALRDQALDKRDTAATGPRDGAVQQRWNLGAVLVLALGVGVVLAALILG